MEFHWWPILFGQHLHHHRSVFCFLFIRAKSELSSHRFHGAVKRFAAHNKTQSSLCDTNFSSTLQKRIIIVALMKCLVLFVAAYKLIKVLMRQINKSQKKEFLHQPQILKSIAVYIISTLPI